MARSTISLSALLAGALMAAFQLLRPWGDVTEEPGAMADAFADPRWLIAHLAGAAGFVALAVLAWAVDVAAEQEDAGIRSARLARWTMAAGAALVLPYYGAETFALHEIGRSALAESGIDVLELSSAIRMNPVAITLFGVGLLLVAVGGIALALAASRLGAPAWATWPLGAMAVLALPQFALPPAGRMAYGVVFLVAAVLFAVGAGRRRAVGAR